ncbi:sialate O-acetylesterase [Lachnospiraceae bacterium NK3A20]|nr:sialate O-acetylesterase [Lachnospiraceae bacterium NK3A20]
MLRLSRLLSDHCILQMGKPIRITGRDTPGREVTVTLRMAEKMAGTAGHIVAGSAAGQTGALIEENCCAAQGPRDSQEEANAGTSATVRVCGDGEFSCPLQAHAPGTGYELIVRDDAGEEVRVRDVAIGHVWFISGQSNIDVDMERCEDSYRTIIRGSEDPDLRCYRLDTLASYGKLIDDPLSGFWKAASRENTPFFSATGYFFTRYYKEATKVPCGFIQSSLGGTYISSWMSEEMLEGYDDLLDEAHRYADPDFMQFVLEKNERDVASWHEQLDRADAGLRGRLWENWTESEGTIEVPCVFAETLLSEFTGSLWFSRTFEVSESMAGKAANLWLGTLVDSDTTWVNGVKVGETGYQYPPRQYDIPEGLLHVGTNRITIRLIVENGQGRFTKGKSYMIFSDQGLADLSGSWEYQRGAAADKVPPVDFTDWKATGLFNGMAYPCRRYPIEGIVWYQGESNTHEPYDYTELARRYVHGYRALWQEDLAYVYCQLPRLDIDLPDDEEWPRFREQQRKAQKINKAAMAVIYDQGEDNDLHPHEKREVGRRLALAALHVTGLGDAEYSGPVPEKVLLRASGEGGVAVEIMLSHADGLFAASQDKGNVVKDFELQDESGTRYPAECRIADGHILLSAKAMSTTPRKVYWLYHNTNHGAMIWNSARLPMGPFVEEIG